MKKMLEKLQNLEKELGRGFKHLYENMAIGISKNQTFQFTSR